MFGMEKFLPHKRGPEAGPQAKTENNSEKRETLSKSNIGRALLIAGVLSGIGVNANAAEKSEFYKNLEPDLKKLGHYVNYKGDQVKGTGESGLKPLVATSVIESKGTVQELAKAEQRIRINIGGEKGAEKTEDAFDMSKGAMADNVEVEK